MSVTRPRGEFSPISSNVNQNRCQSEFDLNEAINRHLSSEDWAQAELTRKAILDLANKSSACRTEVVGALTQAMNKPDLNFILDRRSYYLWSHGSTVLGELKAIESLDLLISHLDLNDGEFSASMSHQPAVRGVERMGILAIPKLGFALQHNKNRNIRLAAALCLADIGGEEAKTAMKSALKSETDKCVRRFIEFSFEKPTEDVLQQRILAFRCGN